ncbi:MAG: hypothetical protein KDA28_05320, partial [Phycisphaerales bacterium]|nr:hypothetical protein [Phycisphaerales bacterium]
MTDSTARRQAFRITFQVVGIAIAIVLLIWSARQAFSDENRAQIEQLREAPVHLSILLVALSFGTILVNGVLFFASIRSVKRIDMLGMQATNAVAWLLSYLPFKISALMRVIIHNRRDGIPVLMVGSWFLVIGLLAATTVLPLAVASMVRDRIDVAWIAIASSLLIVLGAATVLVARWLETNDRIARLPLVSRVGHLESFANLRAGLRMLDTRTVTATTILRVIDIGILAAKFRLASIMVG